MDLVTTLLPISANPLTHLPGSALAGESDFHRKVDVDR
jgi:hypothetical protein